MHVAGLSFAYGAGLVAGCGPCAASRFVALIALTAEGARHIAMRRALWFLAGSAAAYCMVAGAFSTAAGVAGLPQSYLLLSLVCFAGGVGSLWFGSARSGERGCASSVHATSAPAFVGGFLSALIATPCCLPMLAVLAGPEEAGVAAAKAAAFVCGQLTPVLLVWGGQAWLRGLFAPERFHRAGSTVCGGLMLFLAGYYALLA